MYEDNSAAKVVHKLIIQSPLPLDLKMDMDDILELAIKTEHQLGQLEGIREARAIVNGKV